MKKSTKAVLLSGLVFPGAGHFSLDLFSRGLFFFLPALSSLIVLIQFSLGKAYAIADLIEQGKIPLDTAVITSLISAPPTGPELLKIQIATWIIIVCWVAGMVDSFRLGRSADRKNN